MICLFKSKIWNSRGTIFINWNSNLEFFDKKRRIDIMRINEKDIARWTVVEYLMKLRHLERKIGIIKKLHKEKNRKSEK